MAKYAVTLETVLSVLVVDQNDKYGLRFFVPQHCWESNIKIFAGTRYPIVGLYSMLAKEPYWVKAYGGKSSLGATMPL